MISRVSIKMLLTIYIYLISILSPIIIVKATHNSLTIPHQHPNPEFVVQEVQRKLNVSVSRRRQLSTIQENQELTCMTGNPIDDCWRCDPNWESNRQRLSDCGIGFGMNALGGKGGQFYVVTDSSDNDPVNPNPGTLRYGAIQTEPLWIIFSSNMVIKLTEILFINSFKTLDGRGFDVHITNGCIGLEEVSNIIIHNTNVHHCIPTGNTHISSSPTENKFHSKSDGDGITVLGGNKIWIDHCSFSYCTDGLIDVTRGSTGITISNNYFSHHDKVMLLGHSDDYSEDRGMQVTVAFNRFGEGLVQRMPRCRFGYFHVVNNDYTEWGLYAVGGSANPTINSQGNRYTAPSNPNAKEVTRRMDTKEKEWTGWNWRTEGDIMVNGAFFVASGAGSEVQYSMASSVEPQSSGVIDQLTMNAGVLTANGDNNAAKSQPGYSGNNADQFPPGYNGIGNNNDGTSGGVGTGLNPGAIYGDGGGQIYSIDSSTTQSNSHPLSYILLYVVMVLLLIQI